MQLSKNGESLIKSFPLGISLSLFPRLFDKAFPEFMNLLTFSIYKKGKD